MTSALGIDYGQSTVGLALALGPLAELLPSVSRRRIMLVLPRLVEQYAVNHIIVGLPEGRVRAAVLRFISQLSKCLSGYSVAVLPYPEDLSTHDAVALLSHTSQRRRHRREHSAAAAVILQSWLDSAPAGSVKSG